MSRGSTSWPERPVDRILQALREWSRDAYCADPQHLGLWWAFCPVCNSFALDWRTLAIRAAGEEFDGLVNLWCRRGCSEAAIVDALFPKPAPPPIADPVLIAKVGIEVCDLRRQLAEAAP